MTEVMWLEAWDNRLAYISVDEVHGVLGFGLGFDGMAYDPSGSYRSNQQHGLGQDQVAEARFEFQMAGLELPTPGSAVFEAQEALVRVVTSRLKIPQQPSRNLDGRFLQWDGVHTLQEVVPSHLPFGTASEREAQSITSMDHIRLLLEKAHSSGQCQKIRVMEIRSRGKYRNSQ
jgi:RNAse (barnase) inhibitor barstar